MFYDHYSEITPTSFPVNLLSVDALKSDTVDLAVNSADRPMMIQCRGDAGNIKITPAGGQAAITLAVASGEWLPCWVSRLWSTGTSATTMSGVW